MRIAKNMAAALARWPDDGLRHSTGLAPGKPFDPKKSELCRWLLEQPEVHSFIFDIMRDRGWIAFRDGAWHPCDPNSVPKSRGTGNTGAAAKVGEVCSPELALWVLKNKFDDGAAKWKKWQKACEAEAQADKPWGKWAFFHACVAPLKKAGDIMKNTTGEWLALREVADRPEVAPPPAPADDYDWNPETPREILDPIKRKLLAATPATEAGALDQDTILTAAGRDPKGPREHRMAYQEAWIELETVDFSVRFVGAGRFCRAAAAPSSQPAPEVVEV